MANGNLFDSEVTDEVKEAAAEQEAKDQKALQKRINMDKRTLALTTKGDPMPAGRLRGLSTFIDEDMDTPEFRHQLALAGLLRVEARVLATTFAVSDPVNMSNRIRWVASLCGGYVASPPVLLGGRAGISIAFVSAMSKKKRVWVSPGFKAKHNAIFEIVKYLVDSVPGTKWDFIDSAAPQTFFGLSRAARIKSEVVALVTSREAKELAPLYVCLCVRVHLYVSMCACVCVCVRVHVCTCGYAYGAAVCVCVLMLKHVHAYAGM